MDQVIAILIVCSKVFLCSVSFFSKKLNKNKYLFYKKIFTFVSHLISTQGIFIPKSKGFGNVMDQLDPNVPVTTEGMGQSCALLNNYYAFQCSVKQV